MSTSVLYHFSSLTAVQCELTEALESDRESQGGPSYITLRTVRLPDFQSTSEVESSQKNILYASLRFHARVVGSPGATAGMFTFFDDHNESDIEVLTHDPSTNVRYSNQPDVGRDGNTIPDASQDVTLPNGFQWTDWNDHRLDWTPGQSAWYINDIIIANSTYNVPTKPSDLILNMWSDGGVWSGSMKVDGKAYLQIQWIEMVFNTSGPVTGPPSTTTPKRWLGPISKPLEKRKGDGCKNLCTVDGVKTVGFPERNGKSAASEAAPGPTVTVAGRGVFAWSVSGLAALGGVLAVLL